MDGNDDGWVATTYEVIGQEEDDGAAAKRRRSDHNDGYGPDGWRGEGTMDP